MHAHGARDPTLEILRCTVGASQFFLETSAEFHAIAHRPVAPGARVMPCTMRCTAGNERADGPCTCNVEELG